MHSLWRARRYDTAQSCRFGNSGTPRQREARDNYFPSELCCLFAAVWAAIPYGKIAPRGGRTDFSGDGRPRSPARRLPRRAGPWRCFGAVPHRERARCVLPAFGHRGPTHPSSPTPPDQRAVAQIRARNLTNPGCAGERKRRGHSSRIYPSSRRHRCNATATTARSHCYACPHR